MRLEVHNADGDLGAKAATRLALRAMHELPPALIAAVLGHFLTYESGAELEAFIIPPPVAPKKRRDAKTTREGVAA